jgi:hypothetical protein
MPFSADFLRRHLMLRIRDDRLVTRFQSGLIAGCAIRRLLDSLFLLENSQYADGLGQVIKIHGHLLVARWLSFRLPPRKGFRQMLEPGMHHRT